MMTSPPNNRATDRYNVQDYRPILFQAGQNYSLGAGFYHILDTSQPQFRPSSPGIPAPVVGANIGDLVIASNALNQTEFSLAGSVWVRCEVGGRLGYMSSDNAPWSVALMTAIYTPATLPTGQISLQFPGIYQGIVMNAANNSYPIAPYQVIYGGFWENIEPAFFPAGWKNFWIKGIRQ